MKRESELSGQKPVKSLRAREYTSSDRAHSSVSQKITQRVVRWLRPKSKGVPSHSHQKISCAHKILLYRDAVVVQEIYDQVIASIMRDESILAKLKRIIIGQPLLSGDFTFDGLIGVDEFVLKPSAKWTLGLEAGADVELKWNLDSDKNTNSAILMLFSAMPIRNLAEVIRQIKSQRSDTPVEDLIYPGMAISICGTIRRKNDLLPNEVRLRDERYSAQVILAQGHHLDQALRFLRRRPLYVLGIIQTIEKSLTIKAGAVLLGQAHEVSPLKS